METDVFSALGSALARDSATAVIHVDARGVIRFWNEGAAELFGHAAAQAIGRSADLIVPGEMRSAHNACFPQAMRSAWRGSSNWDALEALHASGEKVAAEVFLLPVAGGDAALTGVLAFFRRPAATGPTS
jgi:PAS domain S-box-containing protein